MSKPKVAIERCVLCLYQIGFGYTFISKSTNKNKSLCRKWVLRAGMKRKHIIKSTPCKHPTSRQKLALRMDLKIAAKWRSDFIRESRRVFVDLKEKRIRANEIARGTYYRRKKDPKWRAMRACRQRLWKVTQGRKSSNSLNLIGCSQKFLISWIERGMRRGMEWSNYGKSWEIDHIIPCCKFDLTNPEEQKKCFHYSNLRPLPIHTNRSRPKLRLESEVQPELAMVMGGGHCNTFEEISQNW